mmetsp:Transcript_21330/g.61665  ORF Transcript_21330/g.61665 Transcript_21330/m.61665 type:complete len:261 (+) Transcript_21330:1187-1969(+)
MTYRRWATSLRSAPAFRGWMAQSRPRRSSGSSWRPRRARPSWGCPCAGTSRTKRRRCRRPSSCCTPAAGAPRRPAPSATSSGSPPFAGACTPWTRCWASPATPTRTGARSPRGSRRPRRSSCAASPAPAAPSPSSRRRRRGTPRSAPLRTPAACRSWASGSGSRQRRPSLTVSSGTISLPARSTTESDSPVVFSPLPDRCLSGWHSSTFPMLTTCPRSPTPKARSLASQVRSYSHCLWLPGISSCTSYVAQLRSVLVLSL